MRIPVRAARARAWPALALLLAACAGDGDGLDENGRPIGDQPPEPPPSSADFQSIQDDIFSAVCTACHQGSTAPLGLRLEEGVSYDMLVGVPSVQVPALARVQPGDPDNSYLVQKIEGTAAAGARMPLGGPPLSAEQIAAVRQWISDGALPPAAAQASAKSGPQTAPAAVRNAFALADGALLAATAELDASSIQAARIELLRSGGDGVFGDERDLPVSGARVAPAPYNPRALRLWLPPEQRGSDLYRLRLSALTDLRGLPLDGDGDGRPGGDYQFDFRLRTP